MALESHDPEHPRAYNWKNMTAESHDPGAWPLLVGAVKRANRQSTWLPHGLLRFSSVSKPDGPALVDDGAGARGTVREGVDEAGDVVVLGSICPWGRPLGPTVFLAIRWVRGPWTRPMSTWIYRGSSSPSASPHWPDDEDPSTGLTRLGHSPQPYTAHGRPRRPHGEASGSKGSIGW
jgi:hypothetical protein